MHSAKKKMVSTFGKSKAGEALIKKQLGEDGWTLFSVFITCNSLIMPKKDIKSYKKNALKFCMKVAFLIDSV